MTIEELKVRIYTFDYPNQEVKTAFLELLFHSYTEGIQIPSRFAQLADCDGRIDLAVEVPDRIYIIEFKCNQSADAALRQIRGKGYDKPFRRLGKKIIRTGINFDTQKRNVADWKIDQEA